MVNQLEAGYEGPSQSISSPGSRCAISAPLTCFLVCDLYVVWPQGMLPSLMTRVVENLWIGSCIQSTRWIESVEKGIELLGV